jgi:hypothetical protein
MRRSARNMLIIQAFYQLLRYDLINLVFGFQGIVKTMKRTRTRKVSGIPEASEICRAIETSTCFYPKPVRCLQRSTVTTRLLRQYGGIPARSFRESRLGRTGRKNN